MSARTFAPQPLTIIDPLTGEKQRKCGRHGCGKFVPRLTKGYCKDCKPNMICRNGGKHSPIKHMISPCENGTVFAKCCDCGKAYVMTYPPSQS